MSWPLSLLLTTGFQEKHLTRLRRQTSDRAGTGWRVSQYGSSLEKSYA